MERVKIVSGSGRTFMDEKGRLLDTMGNYTVRPGKFVWTNGRTIYGHMEPGEQPVLPVSGSVLPIPCYAYKGGWGGQAVVEIKRDGSWDFFVKDCSLIGYVGDATHAYGALQGSDGKLKWYDLNTCEFLGEFKTDDACIGAKGELLTIHVEPEQYSDEKTNGNLSAAKLRVVWNTNPDIYSPPYYVLMTDVTQDRSGVTPSGKIERKEGCLEFRQNGKIFRTIPLEEKIEPYVEIIRDKTQALHNANGGDCREKFPSGKRTRPKPIIASANCSPYASRIFPDRDYYSILNTYISGSAFPCIATEGIANPYENISDTSGKDVVDGGWKVDYHARYYDWNPATKIYRDWVDAGVTGMWIDFAGLQSGNAFKGLSMNVQRPGQIAGRVINSYKVNLKAPVGEPIDPQTEFTHTLIPGYEFQYTERLYQAFTWKWDPLYFAAGWAQPSEGLHPGVPPTKSKEEVANELVHENEGTWNLECSYYTFSLDEGKELERESHFDMHPLALNPGYTVAVLLQNPEMPTSGARHITVQDEKGDTVLDMDYDSRYYQLFYYWWMIRVRKISGGKNPETGEEEKKYILCTATSYYPLLTIMNGEITDATREVYSVQNTFSLVPYKNRERLKRNIMKIAGGR